MKSNNNRYVFLAIAAVWITSAILMGCQGIPTDDEVKPSPTPASEDRFLDSRVKYESGESYVIIEFLDDDLVHFELSPVGPGPDVSEPIFTSIMIDNKDYSGPSSLVQTDASTLETPDLRIQVEEDSLCITATDKSRTMERVLSQICPWQLEEEFKGLSFTPESFTHAYGLGQKFVTPGSPDGDWIGRERFPGEFGNIMEDFNNGKAGNTQFPIVYFAGEDLDSYAVFVDNATKQYWDFARDPWKVVMYGDAVRFYLMTGADLADLRSDYMELVGHPLVPPKKMFGLWVSEYGFDNWDELEDKLRTLRANKFPVDGFVLDLQWFGGIIEDSDDTQEGSLTWDEFNFPEPAAKIASLQDEEGVGLIAIEQSYIGRNLPEHTDLEQRGYLVRACETCDATYLDEIVWWGKGGMIDWTSEDASAYWHDWKREPLIQAGLVGHWTDLGEPEIFDAEAWYQGIEDGQKLVHKHRDVHNLYNFLWSKSIYDGYIRNERLERPFILSRSGAPGIQRFGTSIWSGDISGLLSSLATHFNAQMHMSMSGMDYFSADIGGFWRQNTDTTEMYTQWFAYGMLFDVPGRPHTFNVDNWTETAPDRIGDLESNLANVRTRYALSPYLYSLAHRAYLYAEPVFPPLVYYFQDDPQVREMGGEKLIGRDLLVGATANSGEMEREVYLPEGTWVDFHSGAWIESTGAWFGPFLEYPNGKFQLPMFARAGAIIPMMHVDDQTMNIIGKRLDGSKRDELIVRVYADEERSSFTLYEDDGVSTAYQQGEVRTTEISQVMEGNQVSVTIAGAEGTYADALESRDNFIQLNAPIKGLPIAVLLNNSDLPHFETEADLQQAESGWTMGENDVVIAKSGEMGVTEEKYIIFSFSEEAVEEEISEALPVTWPTDVWESISPEQAGLDSSVLADALDYIQHKDLILHNILIARSGYIVLDAPIYRLTSGRPSDGISASRGVLATLIGIALDQGLLEGVDQPILDFFPAREIVNRDSDKEEMTIEDLLTMRSGLDCADPKTELQMKASTDWVQFALDLPMKSPPGEEIAECNLISHLLSAILQEATGETTFSFAQKNLFEPMGISDVSWSADPNGVSLGWQGLRMSPVDSAKLGHLYLNGGNWDGNQLVSNEWVTTSTIQHASTEESGIGYLWKVGPSGTYVAVEEKGQWIAVIPEHNLVVVLTSGQLQREPFTIKVFFRSFIEEAASPSPLPSNPEAYAKLQERLSTVNDTPMPQAVPPLPETALRVSGKTYVMEEGNQLGWREVTFIFPGGSEATFSLLAEGITAVFPIGLDGISRVPSEDAGFPDDALIGVQGWWETEQAFQFVYKYLMLLEQGELHFLFEEDRLEVQVITPEGPITLATGRLAE